MTCVVEGFCWVADWHIIASSMSSLTLSLLLRFLYQNFKCLSCVMNVRIMTGFLMAFITHLKLFSSNDTWRIKVWRYSMFILCEKIMLLTPGSKQHLLPWISAYAVGPSLGQDSRELSPPERLLLRNICTYVINVYIDMYMSYAAFISCDLEISPTTLSNCDVTPGLMSATDTCMVNHLTRFETSRNVNLDIRYVCACGDTGYSRSGGKTKQRLFVEAGVITVSC
jgi:hypothetical protein